MSGRAKGQLSHPSQVFYAEVRALEEKWDSKSCHGDTKVDAIKNLNT